MATSAQNVSQYQESDVKSPINVLTGYVGNMFDNLSGYQDTVNAQARAAAAEYNTWSARQAQITRDYNSLEAAKNRDWQEYMSNTAHRREVRDLQLAGLNPVLSATGGQGAAVGSGATASAQNPTGARADVDMSLTSSMMGLLGKALDSLTAVETSNNSARSAQAQTDKINATTELTSRLGLLGTMYSADNQLKGSMYSADNQLKGSMYSADKHYAGTKYAADTSYAAQKYLADMNYKIKKDFPDSITSFVSGLIGALTGDDSASGFVENGRDRLINRPEKDVLIKALNDFKSGNADIHKVLESILGFTEPIGLYGTLLGFDK